MQSLKLIFTLLASLVLVTVIHAQEVMSFENTSGEFPNTFQAAFDKGNGLNGFWIGYSIERESGNQVSVGSFYFEDDYQVSLRDLINGSAASLRKSKRNANQHGVKIIYGRIINDDEYDKETAILFKYRNGAGNSANFSEISICNLAHNVDLDNLPLLWIGKTDQTISYKFLTGLYKNQSSVSQKKELLPAIGIHSDLPGTTEFLISLYDSDETDKIREDAIFWLGQQNNIQAFNMLSNIVNNDPSREMKKEAVMGIGQLNMDIALNELIAIAKKYPDTEIRKEAVTWLGQKAVDKAEQELKDIVENDPDIEIKKRAVFALADNEKGNVDYLIKLANSNKSLQIRKNAIWALGSMENPRAVDALIKLAQK